MTENSPPPVPSPCINVCTLSEKNICMGCMRTLDEIIEWSMMSDESKRTVNARVAKKLALAENHYE